MTPIATDSTGASTDTPRLYVSDTNTDPMTTAPIAVMPLTLVSGAVDTAHVDIGGDQRVADLFASKNLRLTLTNSLRGPDDAVSSEDLNAKVRLARANNLIFAQARSAR